MEPNLLNALLSNPRWLETRAVRAFWKHALLEDAATPLLFAGERDRSMEGSQAASKLTAVAEGAPGAQAAASCASVAATPPRGDLDLQRPHLLEELALGLLQSMSDTDLSVEVAATKHGPEFDVGSSDVRATFVEDLSGSSCADTRGLRSASTALCDSGAPAMTSCVSPACTFDASSADALTCDADADAKLTLADDLRADTEAFAHPFC